MIKKRYTDIVTVIACLLLFAQCVRGELHNDIKELGKKVAEATEQSNKTKEALNNNIEALGEKVAAFGDLKKQLDVTESVLLSSLSSNKEIIKHVLTHLAYVNACVKGITIVKTEKEALPNYLREQDESEAEWSGYIGRLIEELDPSSTRSVPQEISVVSNPQGPVAIDTSPGSPSSAENTSGSASP